MMFDASKGGGRGFGGVGVSWRCGPGASAQDDAAEARHPERSSPRSTPTSAARGTSRAPKWRSRILAARCSASRSNSSPPTFRTKPDIAASRSRENGGQNENVDAILDLPTSATALAVMELSKQLEKIVIVTDAASSDITGKSCSPYTAHWTYDTYGNAQDGRQRDRQAGWRQLVFHHRRLSCSATPSSATPAR